MKYGNSKKPTRLALLDLEGKLLGYKVDTCWQISKNPKYFKIHRIIDTFPGEHLAQNLLNGLNDENSKVEDPGFIVSVESVSEDDFGEELFRYKIVKEGNKYIIQNEYEPKSECDPLDFCLHSGGDGEQW